MGRDSQDSWEPETLQLDILLRSFMKKRWTAIAFASIAIVLLVYFALLPSSPKGCSCPRCPDVQQLCNCKVELERIGLGQNRPVHPQRKQKRRKHQSLFLPELRKEGWIVDCITWDDKWETNEMEADPHEFNFDEIYSEEKPRDRLNRFEEIYNQRIWSPTKWEHEKLEVSGPGAMLDNSQSILASLHVLVMKLKAHLNKSVVSLLDIGCGDMRWMYLFLLSRNDVDYTCIEIVPDLVRHHKQKFLSSLPRQATFLQGDIVSQAINGTHDLVLCRDVLQYINQMDVMRAIHQISMSNSKFLLVSTFPDTTQNGEIENKTLQAYSYPYNLELPPFLFEPPVCSTYDWGVEHLALWSLPVRQKFDY